jgi:hypothetical protein
VDAERLVAAVKPWAEQEHTVGLRVGFGNSGGLVFMDESAESVATVDGRSSCGRLRWVAAVRR